MIIGLDVHGVIDTDPKFFAKLTKSLQFNGHLVHILTGVEHGPRLNKELVRLNVHFDALFSVTSYLKDQKIKIIKYDNDDEARPIFDNEIWDMAKAIYCCREKIDLHIDDSVNYGKYFHSLHTQYLIYNNAIREFLMHLTKGDTHA